MNISPQVTFEIIACPACGYPDYTAEHQVRDRFRVLPHQAFTIVRCRKCRLLYLNPRPDRSSIGSFYAVKGYDPFVSASGQNTFFSRLYHTARGISVRRKAARVTHGLPAGSATLDVGCATGEFMMELRRRGFRPFGAEPSPQAAEFARSEHGLDVWTGSIEEVPSQSGPFALISFWHVLEHVHGLQQTLERARELLDVRGRISIAVPNPLSRDARWYREEWVAWDAPRHLYHFEPEVMLRLLSESGFRAERAGAVAFDAFYHCLLSDSRTVVGLMRSGARGLASYISGLLGGGGSSELFLAYKR